MSQKPELSKLLRELDDALTMARVAGKRVQSAVPYASNIYDAVDNVMYACDELKKETRNA